MRITWNTIWEAHPDVFIAQNWLECPEDKKKSNRLPLQYAYFMGGETTLRVGIVASPSITREEEFLLAGLLWGNRLSNGAKTVIYFVAPDFSSAFLNGVSKIGGIISARAIYWREKLTPSLYLIPEEQHAKQPRYSIGQGRLDLKRWGQGLNPVARQQLMIVSNYFAQFARRQVRMEIKSQTILFLWGNLEIAEVRRKGKKFELNSKIKWLKDKETKWQKQGWVDVSGSINVEFCSVILGILDYLESLEREGKIRSQDLLALKLRRGDGIIKSLWGSSWPWPWLPKDRSENLVAELEEWYFFQDGGRLNVVCPILERTLVKAARSILLAGMLERSLLLFNAKNEQGNSLIWDGRVHWLTTLDQEDELRRWYCWLIDVRKFPIWTLPENWRVAGIYDLNCRGVLLNDSLRQSDYF